VVVRVSSDKRMRRFGSTMILRLGMSTIKTGNYSGKGKVS